jgi:hypothetical protein
VIEMSPPFAEMSRFLWFGLLDKRPQHSITMNVNNKILVNEPDFQISVFSTHTLDDDNAEITLPSFIDSQLIGSIQFTFSGTVDHSTPIPPADMLRSSAVQSFLRYLTIARLPLVHQFPLPDSAFLKNKDHLGIIDISEVILDAHSLGAPKGP